MYIGTSIFLIAVGAILKFASASGSLVYRREEEMRWGRILLLCAAATVALAVPATAGTAEGGRFAVQTKITSFAAVQGRLVANGTLAGSFSAGGETTRDTAPVRFRIMQRRPRRCDVLTLRLAPLTLELLGVRVQTSDLNLQLYARRGRLLGNLFCALTRARIRLPRIAAAINRRLDRRPLRVMAAGTDIRAADHQGTCQVLRLVLGPLHLDLLGLNVDLFGANRQSPVVATIHALPGHGELGDRLCEIAGGPQPAP
jgi:hypothetical protein